MTDGPPSKVSPVGLFLRWSDADGEGYAAFDRGTPVPPYPEGDPRRYLWLRGWFHREREMRAGTVTTPDDAIAKMPIADSVRRWTRETSDPGPLQGAPCDAAPSED